MHIAPSTRLAFERFGENDVAALAAILAEPEVTRHITADGSTPEHRMATARKRIGWHNGAWDAHGYGVWAVRSLDSAIDSPERLLGWCGFAPPDDDVPHPEILYGYHPEVWGKGVASEAAGHAIDWLFSNTSHDGVTAIIFSRGNPGSAHVAGKLGFVPVGHMPFSVFLSNHELAEDVLAYETWRLGNDHTADLRTLVEQVGFRAGQVSSVSSGSSGNIIDALATVLARRPAIAGNDDLETSLRAAFNEGARGAWMDRYLLEKSSWRGRAE